jgi:hypothetical protein
MQWSSLERMKSPLLVAAVVLAGCTKPNPNACCTTSDQCMLVGLSQVADCSAPDVCNEAGACVAPQCSTSADCSSPDTPYCVGQLCTATCTANENCDGITAHPYCSAGACVECTDSSQCPTTTPVCDATTHACRGCAADTECSSAVCLAATGSCAVANDVVFVDATGSDSGMCDATAPCRTLTYAFSKVTQQRDVVHILGDNYSVGSNAVELDVTAYIDGTSTHVTRASTGPVFTLSAGSVGTVTLGDMLIGSTGTNFGSVSVSGPNVGVISLYGDTLLAPVTVSGAALSIDRSLITAGAVSTCSMTGGVLDVRRSQISSGFDTSSCTVTFAENHFASASPALHVNAGLAHIQNNVFTSTDSTANGVIISADAGSWVRFNTFYNSSGVDQTARAVECNATTTTTVTSNIFAWHSSSPAHCPTQFSLYDEVSGAQPGTSNITGSVASFFVNPAGEDFHLAPMSPALAHGESGLESTDVEGHARPLPSGTDPDIGAYESP